MANVSLRHVYKIYDGGVTAVTDFNLEIEDKEFIKLLVCDRNSYLFGYNIKKEIIRPFQVQQRSYGDGREYVLFW